MNIEHNISYLIEFILLQSVRILIILMAFIPITGVRAIIHIVLLYDV